MSLTGRKPGLCCTHVSTEQARQVQERQRGQSGWSRVTEGEPQARGGRGCSGWQPWDVLSLFLLICSVTSSQNHSTCCHKPIPVFVSTIRGEVSSLSRGGQSWGALMPLEATFFIPDRPLANQLPGKKQEARTPWVYMKLSPHPWHLFLIPKSQSRQFNLEIKVFVFVVARFTGTIKVIHFERKWEKLPGMCLKSG